MHKTSSIQEVNYFVVQGVRRVGRRGEARRTSNTTNKDTEDPTRCR